MYKVSVIVPTYNQEKYIAKALDSIVSQKCNFEYEVIVGDDASKDNTGVIVKNYGEKYPNLIKAIVRENNLGIEGNPSDLIMRATGEYIVMLEGDDYWTCDDKLQKQADFLDEHRDYVAVFARHIIVDENDIRHEEMEEYIPIFKGKDYTQKDFENYFLPGQTATAMFRRSVVSNMWDRIKKNKALKPRVPAIDRFLVLYLLSYGKIAALDEVMAAYRHMMSKESGSWSSKNDYYNLKNVLFFLYSLHDMERIARALKLNICFDERRNAEFAKVADYKGKMSIFSISIIRFFIWLWYVDKTAFYRYVKGRHSK